MVLLLFRGVQHILCKYVYFLNILIKLTNCLSSLNGNCLNHEILEILFV